MGISPYICCYDDCSIFFDDFNRNEIGCKWEVRDGSWSIVELPSSENVLKESGNAGALIIAQRAVPHMSFAVAVDSPSNVLAGATYRVIVNYLDDDNYHFAEFSFPTDWLTIRLGKRSGGSESTLLSRTWEGNLVGSPQAFNVCFSEHIFAAFQKYAPYAAWTTDHMPIPGGYLAGLGNGANVAIDFDDFYLLEHYDTNPDCDQCVCRCDGESPLPMQLKATLTFSGSLGPCDTLEVSLLAMDPDAPASLISGREDETFLWYGTGEMDCSDCQGQQDPITCHVLFECGCGEDASKHFSVRVASSVGDDEECEWVPAAGSSSSSSSSSGLEEMDCDSLSMSFHLTHYADGGDCSGQSNDWADLIVGVGT